jgi:serine protease Do
MDNGVDSLLKLSISRRALLEAKLVLADRDTDLACLKVDATGLPALELSDSSDLKQGQSVLALAARQGSRIP